jgi:molecular chaperone HtpG
MERIKNAVTHKVIDTLKDLAAKDKEKFETFWKSYSNFIKEGMATDPTARERLTPLLRFYSSRAGGDQELTSLSDYAGRMKPEQRIIYYLLGDDVRSAAHSPHLDYFRQQQLEVLYLVDPLDSFLLSGLQSYEGYPLKNVNDPTLDLAKPAASQAEAVPQPEFDALVARFKQQLGERITDVRATDRLVDSAIRLVAPDGAHDQEMDRVRRMLEKDYTIPKKVVEINPQHPLVKNLAKLIKTGGSDDLANDVIEQLYESALLVEGLLPNPADMVGRIQTLMEAATKPAK